MERTSFSYRKTGLIFVVALLAMLVLHTHSRSCSAQPGPFDAQIQWGNARFGAGEFGVLTPATQNPTPTKKKRLPADTIEWIKKLQPGQFVLDTRDGSRLIGTLDSLPTIMVRTDFGEVALPTLQISSIQIAAAGKPCTIVFQNGDHLTATLMIETVTLRSPYGQMIVRIEDIARITSGGKYTEMLAQYTAGAKSNSKEAKSDTETEVDFQPLIDLIKSTVVVE